MPDQAPRDWIEVGRIVGAYGIKGWLRIHPYTTRPEAVLDYRPWRVRRKSGVIGPLTVTVSQVHGKGLIVEAAECAGRDDAEQWAGAVIEAPVSALPELPAGEYYWGELLGMAVQTVGGVALGAVHHLLETGANDVLVVRGADRERLIPYVPAVVVRIDKDPGCIVVDWDPDF